MSIRQEKFGKLIQKELAEVFTEHRSEWFNNAFITISNVTVSPDLGHAKVYMSFFNVSNKNEMLRVVELQTVPIRRELAARIRKQVRIIPELQFFIDDSLDYVFKMEKIFNEINKKDEGEQ
jgi:ribosome-binding factor A